MWFDCAMSYWNTKKRATIVALGLGLYLLFNFAQEKVTELEHTKKLAKDGDAYAQYILGLIYFKGEEVPKDYKEAVKWYRRSAEQGYAPAQLNLGVMHHMGEGVPQDDKQAVKWYRKLAEKQGQVIAQYNLGLIHSKGYGSPEGPQDYKEAVKWYRKAAELGHANAQCNLGTMLAWHRPGEPHDYKEAVKLFRMSAEQGHARAQNCLGRMYLREGVFQDNKEAYAWFSTAKANGYREAESFLGIVMKKMTKEQIAEAHLIFKKRYNRIARAVSKERSEIYKKFGK